MPTTREMSEITHRRIRQWLYDPLFNSAEVTVSNARKAKAVNPKTGFNTPLEAKNYFNTEKQALISTLKTAWQIEFYTIPLYISALYTAENKQTHDLIHGVSIDEMKHLFIVSNALNALHDESYNLGKPVPFDQPSCIPTYPSPLPLVMDACDLELRMILNFDIKPCNPNQILSFCCLELPGEIGNLTFDYTGEDPIRQARVAYLRRIMGKLHTEQTSNSNFLTIGEAYAGIMDKMWELSDIENYLRDTEHRVQLFSGDSRRQFTYFGMDNMAEIVDLRSALNQFRLIVEEGEGSSMFTLKGDLNKRSHFIKFIEIYTECDVSLSSTNSNTDAASIDLTFSDSETLKTSRKYDLKWTKLNDWAARHLVNEEFCSDRSSSEEDLDYPDAYAYPAFTNAYERLIEEFNYLFNTSLEEFRETRTSLSEDELRREFEVFRRKRMEHAIAKMRQMTLHAHHVIDPTSGTPLEKRRYGARPDYNIDFDSNKSYDCSTSESSTSQTKKKETSDKSKGRFYGDKEKK